MPASPNARFVAAVPSCTNAPGNKWGVGGTPVADRVAGTVEHFWLERSYHVATLDFDADVTSQFYFPPATGRAEYYGGTGGSVHPTGPGMYDMVASRFVNGILGN